MPVVMDIGSKYVKILKGSINKKGNVDITECFVEATPEDTVENGHIKNMSELSMFLRNIISKNNLTKNGCYVTVKSSDIVAREINVPAIKNPKLKKVIKNEIDMVFGASPDYYIDYLISDTVVVDYKNIHKVMAYAVPKEIVYSYYELINTIGMKPVAFDTHRNSLYKLFKGNVLLNQAPTTDKVMIFADLGGSYLALDLLVEGKSVFKRSIPITDELEMEEDFESGFVNEYESMRSGGNEYNLYLDGNAMMDDYFTDAQQGMAVSPFYAKVNEEIYKLMQFAISREDGRPVTNIYLYGGNARLQGLDQYLASSLDIPVEKVFNVSNIELKADVDVSDIIAAAGSFIRL